ncbi:MAG: hypothetical protein ACLT2T_10030 [Bilophila wadsworthia]
MIVLAPRIGRNLFSGGHRAAYFGSARLHRPLFRKRLVQFRGRFDGRTVFGRRSGQAVSRDGSDIWRRRRCRCPAHQVGGEADGRFLRLAIRLENSSRASGSRASQNQTTTPASRIRISRASP